MGRRVPIFRWAVRRWSPPYSRTNATSQSAPLELDRMSEFTSRCRKALAQGRQGPEAASKHMNRHQEGSGAQAIRVTWPVERAAMIASRCRLEDVGDSIVSDRPGNPNRQHAARCDGLTTSKAAHAIRILWRRFPETSAHESVDTVLFDFVEMRSGFGWQVPVNS